ncbi:DUF1934 domain-containing protein [Clostridium sp. C105KSO13]|uniref:DUF1934 domain-containing protein n=1 Tax=Clostridium sp. C105KSO13 TaxID=1776045 RepID=UPI00074087E9|nr:DUF1934 domain-containing protein [Clostridium sp. C105KSO13]CUX24478.1 hypothetical protein BN3456_00741 [Clostridium sp. C105KSO13]
MTKDVLISISGLHMEGFSGAAEEENEAIEVVTPGSYYWRNGKHYIIYEEVTEGIPGTTKNKIKITGSDTVEIMKTGLSNTHMIFEKNKKNLTYYQTPYGQMLIGVKTRNMEINVTEDDIDIYVDYEMDVNYQPLADCKIKMEIRAKGTGPFART